LENTIPDLVKKKYSNDSGVFDWTLITCLELSKSIAAKHRELTPIEIEYLQKEMITSYLTKTKAIVSEKRLLSFVKHCNNWGIEVFVTSDGHRWREEAVFKKVFPCMGPEMKVFATSDFGVNKLSVIYYQKLAEEIGIKSEKILIIGDRYEKDVLGPISAGMKSILIGEANKSCLTAPTFECLTPKNLNKPKQIVITGRFQPFHNEHLRYAKFASKLGGSLTVAITNPFFGSETMSSRHRIYEKNNPLPYWLREKYIQEILQTEKIRVNKIIPLPLTVNAVTAKFKAGTVFAVSMVEEWSYEKANLLKSFGMEVKSLYVGAKSISGTEIRQMIRNGDPLWMKFVPPELLRFRKQIEAYIVLQSL